MTEYFPACGSWPTNAVDDIKKAIDRLRQKGFVHNDFTIISGIKVEPLLHYQITNIPYTYYSWLKHHKIIYDLIVKDEIPVDSVRIYASYASFPMIENFHGLDFINPDSYVTITDIQGWEDCS